MFKLKYNFEIMEFLKNYNLYYIVIFNFVKLGSDC